MIIHSYFHYLTNLLPFRFSISLLEGIFQDQRTNVAQNVSIARNACKLKYIVGCAPIVYGVPVAVGCDSFVMDEIVQ